MTRTEINGYTKDLIYLRDGLRQAAEQLGDETNKDYWTATEGNAKRPLLQLLAMAQLRPDGVWDGD